MIICGGYELYESSRELENNCFGIYGKGFVHLLVKKIRVNREILRSLEPMWGITIEEVEKRITTLRDFDIFFTSKLHGYPTPDAYYRHASLGNRMKDIKIPTLLFSSLDDPTLSYLP